MPCFWVAVGGANSLPPFVLLIDPGLQAAFLHRLGQEAARTSKQFA
ncbi:MAG TPA: hypothetical protein VGD78_15490 [Chthoniobacterales bacterium]